MDFPFYYAFVRQILILVLNAPQCIYEKTVFVPTFVRGVAVPNCCFIVLGYPSNLLLKPILIIYPNLKLTILKPN